MFKSYVFICQLEKLLDISITKRSVRHAMRESNKLMNIKITLYISYASARQHVNAITSEISRVYEYSSMGSDNGLAPVMRQAVIWINDG